MRGKRVKFRGFKQGYMEKRAGGLGVEKQVSKTDTGGPTPSQAVVTRPSHIIRNGTALI